MTRLNSPSLRTAGLAAAGALFLGLSLPASAQTPASGAQRDGRTSASGAAERPDDMICVRARFTGSRLPRQFCQTRREWEREGGVPTAGGNR